MGFLDKAKKMADQAQAKLDEVQKQFNEQQGSSGSSAPPPVEYDQHGRPIRTDPSPPHGDPVTGQQPSAPPPPPSAAPTPDPAAPQSAAPPETPSAPETLSAPPEAPATPPGAPDGVEEDRNHPSYAPPKLSQGDPLA